MVDATLVCLANSKKIGGRCVAGVVGGDWLRPVSATPSGTLTLSQTRLDIGAEPALLDEVVIPLAKARPEPHQPENWVIGTGRWRHAGHLGKPAARNLLESLLTPGPTLLGTEDDRIPFNSLKVTPASHSLTVVKPKEIHWEYDYWRRRRCQFKHGPRWYELSVTDLTYDPLIRQLGEGVHERGAVGIADGQDVYLTVSLGEPFERDDCCYKMVAAVIVL